MTIEQIRELAKVPNIFDIEQISSGTWRVGKINKTGGSLIYVTGDSGVVDYVNTCILELKKPITEEEYKEIIDGMAKD